MLSRKKQDEAVDAALERLSWGELPRWTAPSALGPCEPGLNESGRNIFMCHFAGDGTACKSCGAEQPGGHGCFSVGLSMGLWERAQARRWFAMFYDGIDALTDDLVGEAARLLAAALYAQHVAGKASPGQVIETLEQSSRCDARWNDFKQRHGLTMRKACENCGLMFTPSPANDKTCSPACQAARYPKRIREPWDD